MKRTIVKVEVCRQCEHVETNILNGLQCRLSYEDMKGGTTILAWGDMDPKELGKPNPKFIMPDKCPYLLEHTV